MQYSQCNSFPKGYSVYLYNKVKNTRLAAKSIISSKHGSKDSTVAIAMEQESGTGKGNNKWISPPGNLYCSIILEYNREPFELIFLLAISVGAALSADNLLYKWPNDLIIEGKKLGGMIIENHLNYFIASVGINITVAPLETSTKLSIYNNMNIMTILSRILEQFRINRKKIELYGFEQIRQKWVEHAYKLHKRVDLDGNIGTFLGIDRKGRLMLKQDTAYIKYFNSRDVLI